MRKILFSFTSEGKQDFLHSSQEWIQWEHFPNEIGIIWKKHTKKTLIRLHFLYICNLHIHHFKKREYRKITFPKIQQDFPTVSTWSRSIVRSLYFPTTSIFDTAHGAQFGINEQHLIWRDLSSETATVFGPWRPHNCFSASRTASCDW